MSWGYWGIVTGLLSLLAIFFVSMSLVYSGPKIVRRVPGSLADEQGQGSKQPSRLAA